MFDATKATKLEGTVKEFQRSFQGLTVLLTYSRFGVALACLAAVAWILLAADRVESLAAVAVAVPGATAVFGVALALPGITKDGQTHAVRAHDGWIFALASLLPMARRFI